MAWGGTLASNRVTPMTVAPVMRTFRYGKGSRWVGVGFFAVLVPYWGCFALKPPSECAQMSRYYPKISNLFATLLFFCLSLVLLHCDPKPVSEPTPETAQDAVSSESEPTIEPSPEEAVVEKAIEPIPEPIPEPSPEPIPEPPACPTGYRHFSLPNSYDVGKILNVKRCVKDPDPSECTPIHEGKPPSLRLVTVACGFHPQKERDRYNYLVQRITEGFLRTEPYKSFPDRWSIVRNDDLQTGFDITHQNSYCYEAWVNATGMGEQAKPDWEAKGGLWYSTILLDAGKRCQAHSVVVIANHSGWAGGNANKWTGWMSIVGSGNDDRSIRRWRTGTEAACNAWIAKHPGQCVWDAPGGRCLCDDSLPDREDGLPPNTRRYPDCSQQNSLGCPWPFTHPDVFMEYTAIHEVGHTIGNFAHPSPGTTATSVPPGSEPPNCYLPSLGPAPDPNQPCPPWQGAEFKRWVLPEDALGNEPKRFGCFPGCADNKALFAPWQGTQMMIRDDDTRYGFSPVERYILEQRLTKNACWVIGQVDYQNNLRTCQPGPNYDPHYGTGLIYKE